MAGKSARLVAPCRIQSELTEKLSVEGHDANVEVGNVETDRRSLPAPTDGDVKELGIVAQGHLAAGVHLVGADPEVCFGDRVTGAGLVQSVESGLRREEATGPRRAPSHPQK